MSSVVGMTARQMGRAIIMPNLSPPIKTVEQAEADHEQLVSQQFRERRIVGVGTDIALGTSPAGRTRARAGIVRCVISDG